jgi:hypothetical protein
MYTFPKKKKKNSLTSPKCFCHKRYWGKLFDLMCYERLESLECAPYLHALKQRVVQKLQNKVMMSSLSSIHNCVTLHKPLLNIMTLVPNTIETTKITHMKTCTQVCHITKFFHSQNVRIQVQSQHKEITNLMFIMPCTSLVCLGI